MATPASSSGSMTGSAGKYGTSTLWEISQGVFWFSVIFLLHTLSRTEGEKMQAKHGRAGKHKRYQRAAVLALTVLLIILLAGRVLPVCAGKNVPAGASLKQAKPGQTLCFPLETAAWRVSDPYGWRKDPFTGEKAFHRGVDLACAEGTPVLAALDGVVIAARRGAAYGNYVRLTHGDGQETLYAHMQYLYVRAGEVVAAGQRLGTAGQTGRATGAHLHFEFLTGGIRYDPSAALSLP